MATTHVYRLTISYNAAGQFCQNVLHYNFDDSLYADTISAANALITAFDTHCTGHLKDALSTQTKILSYKCRRISGGGGFEAVKLGAVGDVGNRVGDLSASGLAPLIRFVTTHTPPLTGRMYLPGVSDNDCTDGYVTPTYFTDLTDLANALDDQITLAGGGSPVATPVIVSRQPGVGAVAIHVAVPMSILATQRRRQRPA